jgi:hypothetical protein
MPRILENLRERAIGMLVAGILAADLCKPEKSGDMPRSGNPRVAHNLSMIQFYLEPAPT